MKSNWDLKPIYDVIARIPGSTNPDQWIIRGNHHDAWVNGAEDPISGLVKLEEARAFGELRSRLEAEAHHHLLRVGWRTSLIGSTEWVEDHGDELTKHRDASTSIPTPTAAAIFTTPRFRHARKFINDVARDVQDPETKLSVWKRACSRPSPLRQRRRPRGSTQPRRPAHPARSASSSTTARSSSTMASPPARLRMAAGTAVGSCIHRASACWFLTSATPSSSTAALSPRDLENTAVIRLAASADILPFEFTDFADTMQTYVKELKTSCSKRRTKFAESNKQIEERASSRPPTIPGIPPPSLQSTKRSPRSSISPRSDNVIAELAEKLPTPTRKPMAKPPRAAASRNRRLRLLGAGAESSADG